MDSHLPRLTLTPSLTSQIANSFGRPLSQVTVCATISPPKTSTYRPYQLRKKQHQHSCGSHGQRKIPVGSTFNRQCVGNDRTATNEDMVLLRREYQPIFKNYPNVQCHAIFCPKTTSISPSHCSIFAV